MRKLYRALGVDAETIERKLDGDLKREPCPYLNSNLSITPTMAMQTPRPSMRTSQNGQPRSRIAL